MAKKKTAEFADAYSDHYHQSKQAFSRVQQVKHALANSPPGKLFTDRTAVFKKLLWQDRWKTFARCKNVLEVGIGEGEFLLYAPKGAKVIAIDVVKNDINAMKKKGYDARYGDVRNLPFKDNTFDGVHCAHVVEHLDNVYEAFHEMRRVLKKGGVLMIRTPNFLRSLDWFYDDPTHKTPFTRTRLFRLLTEAGFTDIKVMHGMAKKSNYRFLLSLSPRFRLAFEKWLGKVDKGELVAIARK